MRKKITSTNYHNETTINKSCDLAYAVGLIEKRWTLIILCRLENGKMRFNEIFKSIDGITERMLSLRLKELEAKMLITKNILPSVPPHVEYELTDLGYKLSTIFIELRKFGKFHKEVSLSKIFN